MNDLCPVLPATGGNWIAWCVVAAAALIAGVSFVALTRQRHTPLVVLVALAVTVALGAGATTASAAPTCPTTTSTAPTTTAAPPATSTTTTTTTSTTVPSASPSTSSSTSTSSTSTPSTSTSTTSTTTTPTPAPVVSVADITVTESDGAAEIEVVLSAPATESLTFAITPGVGGDTALNGQDYNGSVATVTIAAGGATATAPVATIVDDAFFEGNEQFTATLSVTSGVIDAASDLSAVVTILDDDPRPRVSVAPDAIDVEEGVGSFNIAVTRTGASSEDITFHLEGFDLGATSGADYLAIDESPRTIAASGNATETITVTVTIVDDATVEDFEGFDVDLVVHPSTVFSDTVRVRINPSD